MSPALLTLPAAGSTRLLIIYKHTCWSGIEFSQLRGRLEPRLKASRDPIPEYLRTRSVCVSTAVCGHCRGQCGMEQQHSLCFLLPFLHRSKKHPTQASPCIRPVWFGGHHRSGDSRAGLHRLEVHGLVSRYQCVVRQIDGVYSKAI